MGFQTSVNITQAPAVEGDIASLNPRHVLPGAAGSWVAGSGGVTLGRFAWGDLTGTDSVLVNSGSGAPTCIVAREIGDALITTYLSEAGMTIPQGFQVGLPLIGGDVWVKNTGAGAAAIGQKAFASLTTGQVQFAAAGATVSGYIETKWYAATIGAAGELVKITSTVLD
jgi:hypothetical protein